MKKKIKKKKVAVLGGTGLVGRYLCNNLVDHPSFELAAIIGSANSSNQLFSKIWKKKEERLFQHYGEHFWHQTQISKKLNDYKVSAINELDYSDIDLIFSSVSPSASEAEDFLIKQDCFVVSNSPYKRLDPLIPLVVPEVNANLIKDNKLIKCPNCVSVGLSIILNTIKKHFGLKEVVVATYQSLSGRGDAKYDQGKACYNVFSLANSNEEIETLIKKEIKKMLSDDFLFSINCVRVFVAIGHFVNLKIKTSKKIESKTELINLIKKQESLLVTDKIFEPTPLETFNNGDGMHISIGNITLEDDIFDLQLNFTINNLIKGASGNMIQIAEALYSK